MEEIKIIKRYEAKSGEVTVTQYINNGRYTYRAKHSNNDLHLSNFFEGEWNKSEAIKCAQFWTRY